MASGGAPAVLAALAASGDRARFVGGCVRDALAGRAVNDVDIATPTRPDRVIRLLEDAGIRALPTGLAHGTVTAAVDGAAIEVTTLRRDVATDGRRATVRFTDDWAADAARRDFTMNALYCDPDGTVHDHTGGLADLRAGRVRFVGSARRRIAEDALRMLRFFRFHAWYGAGPPDADALAACRELAPGLAGLAAERVWSELAKTLRAPEPAAAFASMEETGALAVVLGEASLTEVDRQYVTFADRFEREYVNQGFYENRSIEDTLRIGWRLLGLLPRAELKRVDAEHIEKYLDIEPDSEPDAEQAAPAAASA